MTENTALDSNATFNLNDNFQGDDDKNNSTKLFTTKELDDFKVQVLSKYNLRSLGIRLEDIVIKPIPLYIIDLYGEKFQNFAKSFFNTPLSKMIINGAISKNYSMQYHKELAPLFNTVANAAGLDRPNISINKLVRASDPVEFFTACFGQYFIVEELEYTFQEDPFGVTRGHYDVTQVRVYSNRKTDFCEDDPPVISEDSFVVEDFGGNILAVKKYHDFTPKAKRSSKHPLKGRRRESLVSYEHIRHRIGDLYVSEFPVDEFEAEGLIHVDLCKLGSTVSEATLVAESILMSSDTKVTSHLMKLYRDTVLLSENMEKELIDRLIARYLPEHTQINRIKSATSNYFAAYMAVQAAYGKDNNATQPLYLYIDESSGVVIAFKSPRNATFLRLNLTEHVKKVLGFGAFLGKEPEGSTQQMINGYMKRFSSLLTM